MATLVNSKRRAGALRRELKPARIRLSLVVEYIAASVAAIALAAWLTWPVALHLGDRILGYPGDSTGTIGGFWELAHNGGFHVVGSHHNTYTGAPFGWQQGNGINITAALVFYPLYLGAKFGREVAAYNLVVLSGFVLSTLAMYVLVRRLGMSAIVAGWAGLVYTVFPWHIEKAQGHASFVHLEGFPLLVLAALAWYRRPDFTRAVLLAVPIAILWTTVGYFGVIGSVALVTLLVVAAVMQRATRGGAYAVGRFALGFAPSGVVMLLVYAIANLGAGFNGVATARQPGELLAYGARPWEYVLPSYRNIVFGDALAPWLASQLHTSNFSETTIFVGWLTLLLALSWVVWAILRRTRLTGDQAFATAALTALVFVGVWCSAPSPIPRTSIPMPSRIIWQVAPEFRVPTRFIALVMTALVPLAAFSLEAVRVRVSRERRLGRPAPLLATVVVLVAATVSYLELGYTPPAITTTLKAAPEYAAVESAPPGVLAEYPLVAPEFAVNSDYLFAQRFHQRPLLNGAPVGTVADAVRATLVNPASPGTAANLAAVDVSAIVTRPTTYLYTGGTGEPHLGSGYKLVTRASDGASVWRVTAKPAPALAAFMPGFDGPETPPGTPTSRWLGKPSARVELIARRPGTYLAHFGISSYGVPRTVRIVGRDSSKAFRVSGFRTISVPITLPRGQSSVLFSTSPGPQPIPDGRSVSVYVQNWRFSRLRTPSTTVITPFRGVAE